MTTSAFAKYVPQAWPYRYSGTLMVDRIAGGTPTDPKVAEGWIRTKLGEQTDDIVRAQVAETMVERGVSAEEAVELVNSNRHLNGFKRDDGGLYIEGRQLKAAIKEAASVAAAAGKLPLRQWGKTNKGLLGFVSEHVCVVEDKLPLGVTEPTGMLSGLSILFAGRASSTRSTSTTPKSTLRSSRTTNSPTSSGRCCG